MREVTKEQKWQKSFDSFRTRHNQPHGDKNDKDDIEINNSADISGVLQNWRLNDYRKNFQCTHILKTKYFINLLYHSFISRTQKKVELTMPIRFCQRLMDFRTQHNMAEGTNHMTLPHRNQHFPARKKTLGKKHGSEKPSFHKKWLEIFLRWCYELWSTQSNFYRERVRG